MRTQNEIVEDLIDNARSMERGLLADIGERDNRIEELNERIKELEIKHEGREE